MILDPLTDLAVLLVGTCTCRVCGHPSAMDHIVKRNRKSRSGLSLYFVRVCRRCRAVEAQ